MAAQEKPLPPGSSGLPLLGETLALLGDNYGFVRDRVAKHGPIFRSRVLGRDAAFLAGAEGTALFNDEDLVQRAGGMPDFIEQFFGGKSLPLLDGTTHRARKEQVMAAFSRAALESYVPGIEATVARWLARLAAGGEFRAADRFKTLALETIGKSIFGLDPGPELDIIIREFATLTAAFSALPIDLPGTKFRKALAAKERIFDVLRAVIRRHHETPHDDGLGRILAADSKDGKRISDDGALLEVHHFNLAGYLIYTLFCALLVELDRQPKLRERLAAEVAAVKGPLDLATLDAMPLLNQVVREAKRFTPFVSLFFGKAKRDFDFGGYRVPEGWTVIWSQHATNFAHDSFRGAEQFDPERFAPERAEHEKHPCAYAPQGAGELTRGHKCAGYDYSTIFVQVFTVLLVRGYTWRLPPQNLNYVYKMVPPEHADGLRVVLEARS
jgi:retinoid hydroxylase